MSTFDHVPANLSEVKARIATAARASNRSAADVQLVAVSKTHPTEAVMAALAAGHRVFGENRVQEAAAKFPALRTQFPDLKLHLIGPLQTNKIRQAVETCDAIESVDRDKLAQGLAAELAKQGPRRQGALDLFIQINIGEEPQKAGVLPLEADDFIRRCRDEYRLPIVGLMCIPPAEQHPAPHFALLAKIAARHGLTRLSMGMSGDYELAIQFGATHVRVGTAIFGARPPAAG